MVVRQLFIVFSGLLTLFFARLPAYALRFEQGQNVRIAQPFHEDIYILGGTISIEAPIYGDVWCIGGTVILSDTVQGDVVVAGGKVSLRGLVTETVRVAAGTLTLAGQIGGDLLIVGGTVTTETATLVEGNLALAGGNVLLQGIVQGEVKVACGTLTLENTVRKDIYFNGGELYLNGSVEGRAVLVAGKITLGPRAMLNEEVRYWTAEGAIAFDKALRPGVKAIFDTSLQRRVEQPNYWQLGFSSFATLLWYLLAMLVLLWVGHQAFSTVLSKAAKIAHRAPAQSLGYGFLYFILAPVVAFLLLLSLIGIPLGSLVLLFYLLSLLLSHVVTALVATHWLAQQRNYSWPPAIFSLVALGMLVVLRIIGFIPFIGWVVKALLAFVAFGAILASASLSERSSS
ncbi:MAG: hypothetical protein NZM43_07140 [Saprospiraceae bacterium]|nr:hypothetical protein [Saprospiraceae bacterium]MDW8484084.1 polymer-forming cytoskeletal protein [Saprospiraceae bacterium]